MEKIENIKKDNRLTGVLSNKIVKYAVGTFLLSALGVALPRGFHLLAGSSAGATFLPMHICILIAALTFGIVSSTLVAGSSVVFSFLLTGMPSLARLPYMLIELVIYAILLSLFNKKFNSYVSLIATIVLGRIVYSGVLFAAIHIFGLPTYGISVMQSIMTGIPGIMIQLAAVPFIAKVMNERLKLKND